MAKPRNSDRRGSPAGPEPSADEAQAFREAVRDVKPLAQPPMPDGLQKPRVPVRRGRSTPTRETAVALMPLIDTETLADSPELPAIAGGDALAFQRAGVRTRVVQHLRRGLIPVEDELDLHGLTQSAARLQLARFLDNNRDAGRRCVRIIHGKGYRSGARGPILKIAVDTWLRHHRDVMAFTSARPIDGGTGAVYVLLRA